MGGERPERPGPPWRNMPTGSFCLCRTDPNAAKKQEGISFILIDMKTPGITVRPIQTLDGGHEVNEVWFDEVRVPYENLVGKENKGWDYAKFLLGNERTGIARVGRIEGAAAAAAGIGEAGTHWRQAHDRGSSDFREKLTAVEIELRALEMTQLRVVAGRAGPGQGQAEPGEFDPQDQGLRNSAGDHGVADGIGWAHTRCHIAPRPRPGG